MKHLYIIGCGGFSKQVIEMFNEVNSIYQEYEVVGLIDDNPSLIDKNVLGYNVVGDTDYLENLAKEKKIHAIIAIGQGNAREAIFNKLPNVNWINLIHPNTIISRHISMGKGNIICGGTIINPDCKIGNHCNINIGCTLGHDVILEDFVTLMPGCNVSGNVFINKTSTIGTGSCIIQNVYVGENSIIGAGAVVLKDVDKSSVYVGIPARKIKNTN